METVIISTAQFSHLQYYKAGQGPAVVLLHGFPEDGCLWNNVVPGLADSFTVLVPDIPGSGASKLDKPDVSIEDLSHCINAILDQEHIEEAVVAGHSMGGYIALAFAAHNANRLKGLSMIHSTATADTEEKKQTRLKSIELIRKGGKEAFVKGMIPNLFSADFRERHPTVVKHLIERGIMLSSESMISFYNAMINRPDRTNILKDAAFPVQWVIGKEDQVVPVDSSLQQSRLANVNFVSLYANCGHMSMLEAPERLTNDLREFLVFCYNR